MGIQRQINRNHKGGILKPGDINNLKAMAETLYFVKKEGTNIFVAWMPGDKKKDTPVYQEGVTDDTIIYEILQASTFIKAAQHHTKEKLIMVPISKELFKKKVMFTK